jgi:hypothetical protein
MKSFRTIPQGYFKLLLELVVIFLSVVLAFFFDDYREKKGETDQYKSDLLLFRRELVSEIVEMAASIDSFQVSNPRTNGGDRLKQLLNLIWIDSLIDQKRASMQEFRYIIESYYLFPFISDTKISPLANEISVKYSNHISDRIILNGLSIYQEEMTNLQKVNVSITEGSKKIISFIHKTSPNLEFDRQDSILFYSKEVIWAFKNVLMMQREKYAYEKYLAQKRLIVVVEHVDHELRALDVQIPGDSDCYGFNFKKRYECRENRPISQDAEILKIKDIVVHERNEFLSKHRK